MLTDPYELAAGRIEDNARKVCQSLPNLWNGEAEVPVYPAMHSTDAPNAVALLGYPVNMQTKAYATGHHSMHTFDVRVYVRTTNSDEAECKARASRIVWALLLMANADPRLGGAVERVDANVGEWDFGTDNSKMSTAIARIDYTCSVVNQDIAEIRALLG